MEDSMGVMEVLISTGVLCCCCTLLLGLIGGGVYFVMQSQKKSSPTSGASSMPSTPAASGTPFGTPNAANLSSPFDAPATNTPSGPPPGDVRKTLDALAAPDQPYLLEVSSAYQYMVRWPSADVHGLGPSYQLQINLDDANRTARFTEVEPPLVGTPGAASVEMAKNAIREALTNIGWRVQ